ncbi:MAG: hypothetical protein HUK21_08390 [Fibrobacteraceae bacterium]|nr:hypothetical protein [Fibrobacteraceae bacterium]
MNIPTSKEEAKREKDLYHTVLSFLRNVRKAGRTNSTEWEQYRGKLKALSLEPDLFKAADMWTMDNLDQFTPDKKMLPPLNDMEAVAKISPEFLSQLLEALFYGMLNLTQANLISDEIQDADPEFISRESLEELLVKLWMGNARSYKKMTMN